MSVENFRDLMDGDRNFSYRSPLEDRYCSKESLFLASEGYRWTCVRKVWIAVLESQIELGILKLSREQIEALEVFKSKVTFFEWDVIAGIEKKTKHDVMAHITYVTKHLVPELGDVIHVGMTSEDATSGNGEILQQNEWIKFIIQKSVLFLREASKSMELYKNFPILGETHWQKAGLVTFGKRIGMWISPIVEDLIELEALIERRVAKGVRGAVGTSESLLKLCENDKVLVSNLQNEIGKKLGVEITKNIVGQTAPRNWDFEVIFRFASITSNLAKIAFDIRKMASDGYLDEPRGKDQVGSSAMPWKKNPMKCERIDSLARVTPGYLMSALFTQQVQGQERTLDDSAGRRIYFSGSFLILDAILILATEVISGMQDSEAIIKKSVQDYLPFLYQEELLALAVKSGIGRQEAHEYLRTQTNAVYASMNNGGKNDILERLANNPDSPFKDIGIKTDLNPIEFVGMSVDEVDRFSFEVLKPLSERYEQIWKASDIEKSVV